MNSRKVSKGTRRRMFVFGTISLVSIIYLGYTLYNYTTKIANLQNEHKYLTRKIEELKVNENNLENEIIKLKDPEYIAKYARENYQYSKDGEYIIQLPKKEKTIEKGKSKIDLTLPIVTSTIVVSLFIIIKKINHK